MTTVHILKDLQSLIRDSTLSYSKEIVRQDIELTSAFKNAYSRYLEESGADIEFFNFTAIITSSSGKSIFVPNQWFVIASYTVGVIEELQKYKNYFCKIAEYSGQRPNDYAKKLRERPTLSDKQEFMYYANKVFSSYSDDCAIEEASSQMWRFVSDYTWWSGQKTIDRGDFFYSVVLNMLNLVNASQSYVAEIASAFTNDSELRNLLRDRNITASCIEIPVINEFDCVVSDEEISELTTKEQDSNENVKGSKHNITRIKIAEDSPYREIKIKHRM